MIKNLFEKLFLIYGKFVFRFRVPVFLGALFLTAVSAYVAKDLKLNSNLAALLPESHEIVRNFHKISEIYGGMGNLVMVIRGQNPDGIIDYMDVLVPKLRKYKEIRYVEYRKPVEFFRRNMLLYADTRDIRILYRRLYRKLEYERMKHNPLLIDFDEKDPGFYYRDIIRKYEKKYRNRFHIGKEKGLSQSYFYKKEKRDGKVIHSFILMIKPQRSALRVPYAMQVFDTVRKIVRSVPKNPYDPSIRVHYTGRYRKSISDFQHLRNDFGVVSVVSLGGILVMLLVYFRNLWPLLMIFGALISGIIWTLALTKWIFGSLNLITSFLVAILMGLGIDFGIHFILRYKEEKRRLQNKRDAFFLMFSQTGAASFSSALTTSFAFLGLATTELRAFREFGAIAGIGILVLLLSMTTFLGALLVILDEHYDLKIDKRQLHIKLPRVLWKYPVIYIVLSIALTVVSIYEVFDIRFDYDFSKIQARNTEAHILDHEVNRLLKRSQNPTVVIPKDLANEREILSAVQEYIDKNRKKKDFRLDKVFALSTFIPSQQQRKLVEIRRIRNLLAKYGKYYKMLSAKNRRLWHELERKVRVRKITIRDLPAIIQKTFAGIGKYKDRHVVLILPKADLVLGLEWKQFAEQIEKIRVDGKALKAASDEMIFAEILRMIEENGPTIMVMTILAVFMVVSLNFTSFREGMITSGPLLISITWILGVMGLSDFPADFFNVIMFPIIIGIGIDSSIHIYHRYRESGDLIKSVQNTGEAVLLSSATTAVGFGSLILASNEAMKSMGTVALLGIGFTYLSSMFLLPSLIRLLSGKMEKKKP